MSGKNTGIKKLSQKGELVSRNQTHFYHRSSAGTYGLSSAVKTATVKATFVAANTVPASTVYELIKTLFEKKGEIDHAKAADIDPAYAVEAVTIPFHPGAKSYLREIGALP